MRVQWCDCFWSIRSMVCNCAAILACNWLLILYFPCSLIAFSDVFSISLLKMPVSFSSDAVEGICHDLSIPHINCAAVLHWRPGWTTIQSAGPRQLKFCWRHCFPLQLDACQRSCAVPCLPVLPRTMLGVWLGPKVCISDFNQNVEFALRTIVCKPLKRFFIAWI